jgi:TatD DNase family protein
MNTDLSGSSRRGFLLSGPLALASFKLGMLGRTALAAGKVGYSDSHVHLDSYSAEALQKALAGMKEKNVSLVLNVSINLATSAEAIKLAQTYSSIYAAVGIHPGETVPLTAEVKKKLEELSGQKRVVALGEIGLMYERSTGTKEEQQQLFQYQLSLANNLHIPIDIHYSNDAHQDIIRMCKEAKGSSGIVHGFSGTMAELKDWLGLGYYISIGKSVTGMGGMGGRSGGVSPTEEVIKAIPADRLITETDSMFMGAGSRWNEMGPKSAPSAGAQGGGAPGGAPPSGGGDRSGAAPGGGAPGGRQAGAPGGGQGGLSMQEEFNQPADVVKVAEKIASIRGVSAEEMGDIATNNLKRVLKIK